MENIILSKASSSDELRRYFMAVLEVSKSGNEFPINLDEVWPLCYGSRNKAVVWLKENFLQDVDYQTLDRKVKASNAAGYVLAKDYMLTVPCMEFFIARKVRAVFEVYRQVFHRAVKPKSPWELVTSALQVAQNQLAIYQDQLAQARAESADTYKMYRAQKEENTKLLPDANYTRTVLNSQNTWNTNVIAKEMGMSAVTLNKHLKNLNIQYKQHGVWLLTESYQGKGYTKSKTYSYLNAKGEVCSRLQMEWTERGRRWLLDMHKNGKF